MEKWTQHLYDWLLAESDFDTLLWIDEICESRYISDWDVKGFLKRETYSNPYTLGLDQIKQTLEWICLSGKTDFRKLYLNRLEDLFDGESRLIKKSLAKIKDFNDKIEKHNGRLYDPHQFYIDIVELILDDSELKEQLVKRILKEYIGRD